MRCQLQSSWLNKIAAGDAATATAPGIGTGVGDALFVVTGVVLRERWKLGDEKPRSNRFAAAVFISLLNAEEF